MFITVNGIRLYYEKYGEGRPLVMLHGNGEDCTIFDRAWPILEKRFCCYLIDSRSHGQSEEGELHYETMAKDMRCFLDMLDLRSEERRVGKECTEQCRSRWSPDH